MREMKDSGIEWIGEIPKVWDVIKVKDGFYRKNKKANQKDPIILSLARDGIKVRDVSNNEGQLAVDYTNYNPVNIDDLLLNPMDLISGDNCSISKVEGVISPAYTNLRYKEGIDPHYYNYYFKYQYWSMAFFSYGKGVSFENRWTLNNETLMNFPIVLPPFQEQKSIAHFLDAKCTDIDALTADIQTQIDTLELYKRSVITETLFSNDYAYTKMKYVGSFQNGMNFSSKIVAREVPFLGVGDFQNNMVVSGREAFSSIMYDGIIPCNGLLKNDDIVFVRSNGSKSLVGRSVLVRNIDFELTYSGFCIRFRKQRSDFDSKFILYAMWSNKFREVIDSYTRGTNITNVSQDMLKNVLIPVVPLNKQLGIVKKLDEVCGEIDAAILEKNKQRDVLCEYKKSLIYEYVTGKKEVPANA